MTTSNIFLDEVQRLVSDGRQLEALQYHGSIDKILNALHRLGAVYPLVGEQ